MSPWLSWQWWCLPLTMAPLPPLWDNLVWHAVTIPTLRHKIVPPHSRTLITTALIKQNSKPVNRKLRQKPRNPDIWLKIESCKTPLLVKWAVTLILREEFSFKSILLNKFLSESHQCPDVCLWWTSSVQLRPSLYKSSFLQTARVRPHPSFANLDYNYFSSMLPDQRPRFHQCLGIN